MKATWEGSLDHTSIRGFPVLFNLGLCYTPFTCFCYTPFTTRSGNRSFKHISHTSLPPFPLLSHTVVLSKPSVGSDQSACVPQEAPLFRTFAPFLPTQKDPSSTFPAYSPTLSLHTHIRGQRAKWEIPSLNPAVSQCVQTDEGANQPKVHTHTHVHAIQPQQRGAIHSQRTTSLLVFPTLSVYPSKQSVIQSCHCPIRPPLPPPAHTHIHDTAAQMAATGPSLPLPSPVLLPGLLRRRVLVAAELLDHLAVHLSWMHAKRERGSAKAHSRLFA